MKKYRIFLESNKINDRLQITDPKSLANIKQDIKVLKINNK